MQIKLASRWCSFLWLPITCSSTFALLCSLGLSYTSNIFLNILVVHPHLTSSCCLRKGSPKGFCSTLQLNSPLWVWIEWALFRSKNFPHIYPTWYKSLSLCILLELPSLIGGRHLCTGWMGKCLLACFVNLSQQGVAEY